MREPDEIGVDRMAWRLKCDSPTALSCWLIWCMDAHPCWHWWIVSLAHLRNVEGIPNAHRSYGKAEYELAVWALDPSAAPPDPDGEPLSFTRMSPMDICEQFHGVSDEQASAVCEHMIHAVCRGLSPDRDYRDAWGDLLRGIIEGVRTRAAVNGP